MIISDVSVCKKTADRLNIYLDGEFAFSLHYDIWAEESLSKGDELSPEKIDELIKKDEFYRAKKKAFDILSRRSYSAKELMNKLCEKGISKETASDTAEYFIKRGYISDEKYAESKISYLFEVKKFGRKRVEAELAHSGVNKEIIAEYIEKYFEDGGKADIVSVYEKLAGGKDIKDPKIKNSIFAKLMRRGFSADEIRKVIDPENENEF